MNDQQKREARARALAATEGYPVHLLCGGECERVAPSFYWCHGCDKRVPWGALVVDKPSASELGHDVLLLLESSDNTGDTQ